MLNNFFGKSIFSEEIAKNCSGGAYFEELMCNNFWRTLYFEFLSAFAGRSMRTGLTRIGAASADWLSTYNRLQKRIIAKRYCYLWLFLFWKRTHFSKYRMSGETKLKFQILSTTREPRRVWYFSSQKNLLNAQWLAKSCFVY